MKNIISRLFLLPLFAAALLASCVTDERMDGVDPVPQSEELTIAIAVPGNSRPATRALTTADEYDVKEIAVLAFDADDKEFYGRYAGSFSGTPAHQSGTVAGATMTFSVSLPLGEFDLMVVANAGAILDNAGATLTKGEAQNAVLDALKMTMGTAGWDVDATPAPLPMWGYKKGVSVPENFTGAGTTLSSAIRLTRMVAKVDVKLAAGLIAADKFELETVRVYNYVEQGRLVPTPLSNWEDGDNLTLNDTPTLPAGYTKADAASNEYLEYTLGTDETSLVRSIYLFESPKGVSPVSNLTSGMKNTCLVIGGSYNGGAKSWYRIDFTEDTDPDTTDDVHNWVYMPILRNNVYSVTVTDITGDGFGSASDALGSAPVNINTNTLEWADDNIHVAATNGIYMLGLSQGAFEFTPDARTTASTDNELIAVTDYSGGWKAEIFDTEAGTGTTARSWLSLSTSSVSSSDDPDGTSVRLIAAANASTTADRTAWIHITAGAVKLRVEVTQERALWAGALAAPGVIGYIKGTNKLTIKGSKEYLGTPVMTDPNDTNIATATSLATGEPLENATVYAAQFRWGSLVATATEFYSDGPIASSPALPFAPRDIVAAPKDYNNLGDADLALAAIKELAAGGPGGTNTGAAAWGTDANQTIPFRGETTGGQSLGWTLDAANGLGDPCEYYFGDGWKLPMGNPWFKDGGTPFGARVTATGWSTANAGGNYLGSSPLYLNAGAALYFGVAGAVGGDGEGYPDWSMFLPVNLRYRAEADGLNTSVSSVRYWSSTANSSTTGSTLYASSSDTSSRGAGSGFGFGYGIRCVKSTPATTLGVTPADRTFDWDAFDQGQSQVFTVTADGAWTTVFPGSAMNNFEIKQYTAQGTLVTTANNNESYAFFGFGNGTIVVTPRSNNTSTTTERTFAFTVEAIGATATAAAPKTVTVTQSPKPIPGVRNVGTAEGVIGYIHRPGHPDHHKLTMEKDNDGDDTNGIVYVAYFKFGSLVATSSEDHGAFTSNDIVAWPTQWAPDRTAMEGEIGTVTGQTSWTNVPVSAALTPGATIGTDLANGLGDPCDYWFGDHDGDVATATATENWRLPTAKENTVFVGGDPTNTTWQSWVPGNSNYSWTSKTGAGGGTSWPYYYNASGVATTTAGTFAAPASGRFPVAAQAGRTAFSEVLPAAGHRLTNGSVGGQGSDGFYWSSTAHSGTYGYYLTFSSALVYPASYYYYAFGFSVRCVRQ